MDSFFSIGVLGTLVLLLVVIVAVQQVQQNAQYREIQDRLREIRQAEMLEQQSLALRSERSTVIDPLNALEMSVQGRASKSLSTEELTFVDNARKRIRTINSTLVSNRQWMGAPFDLDWPDILERIPVIRAAYLAANFAERPENEPPQDPANPSQTAAATPATPPTPPVSFT
jgi:hypothetical protein